MFDINVLLQHNFLELVGITFLIIVGILLGLVAIGIMVNVTLDTYLIPTFKWGMSIGDKIKKNWGGWRK